MQQTVKIIEKGSDYVYYNIDLYNKTSSRKKLEFYDSRSSSILPKNPSDYKLQITKFTIPLASLPVMIFPSVSGEDPIYGNPNNSLMYITITYLGVDYSAPVQFIRSSFSSSSKNNLRIYSVQMFIDMINKTFYDIMNPLGLKPIFMTINEQTDSIRIWFTNLFVTGTNKVYFNAALYRYFQIFQNIGRREESLKTNELVLKVNNPNNSQNLSLSPQLYDYTAIFTPPQLYYFIDSESYLDYIYSSKKLVFTTSLPIKREFVPLSGINSIINTSDNKLNILTDFSLNPDNRRGIASYFNRGEDRWVDLNQILGGEITSIGIQCYLEYQGNYYDIYLQSDHTFTMKLLFKKS